MSEISTKEKLAIAFRGLYEATYDGDLIELIERARAGYYDTYDSPVATPLVQLVNDLRELQEKAQKAGRGFHVYKALCQRVVDGDFDGTPAEDMADP